MSFSVSLYFFPDGQRETLREVTKTPTSRRPPIPGQQRGGGFPGFLPLSAAFTFLTGLLGRVTSPAEDC